MKHSHSVLAFAFAISCSLIVGCGDAGTTSPVPFPDVSAQPDGTVAETGDDNDAIQTDEDTSVDATLPNDSANATDGGAAHDSGPSGCVSDLECDDSDPCTIDACDVKSGFCSHDQDTNNPACAEATNSACEASETPGTADQAIQDCVCTADPFCCETMWDALCVNQAEDCGALCGCKDPAADLSCAGDADCAKCNDENDLCAEKWTCSGGTCVNGGPVVCDTSNDTGCMVSECNYSSGECEQAGDNSLCDDQDFCTTDSCDEAAGQCTFEKMEGCGTNPPCQTAATPGSNDPVVTECVCAIDDFCCSEWFGWTPDCAELAEESCGLNCDCTTLPDADLACQEDADCGWCGTANPCDGVWTCQGGVCSGTGPTVCETNADTECMKNECNPETIHCEMTPQPQVCDDGDTCTADVCDEATGQCSNEVKCGTNSACEAVAWPGSNDPAITECVCNGEGADPYCCNTAWDGLCVRKAEMYCGASCDCSNPDTDLSCENNEDCNFCNEDVCDANWTCLSGTCAKGGPLQCDTAADQGCLMNTCQSFSGTCEVVPNPKGCDDQNSCTADQCDAETGGCINTPIPGCMGEPTFECKGAGEASVQGCEYVQTYEGCCDPWGRTIWCEKNEETGEEFTVCIDCAGTNPFCGWGTLYYTCATEGEASPDAAFPMQCPGLTYAP
jgi:hypothetical protein